jgi:hypothetical protein
LLGGDALTKKNYVKNDKIAKDFYPYYGKEILH